MCLQEFFFDDHSVESVIHKNPSHPFPVIKEHMDSTEVLQIRAENQINKLSEDQPQYSNLVEHADALSAYQEYLKNVAQCAFVQQRAASLEAQVKFKYKHLDPDPIHVFSVSSSLYINWMKSRRRADPVLTPEMTGIPKLRKFLMGLGADDNMEAYRQHVVTILPEFIGKIERIVDCDKKNDAFAEIRPYFKALLDEVKTAHEAQFADFLRGKVLKIWGNPFAKDKALDAVTEVLRGWSIGTKYNTYNKFLREGGIVKNSRSMKYGGNPANWNQEISEAINPDLVLWHKKMKKAVADIAILLDNTIKSTCEHVVSHIDISSLPESLKGIALAEWKPRQVKNLDQSAILESELKEALRTIYVYASTETDRRCPIYNLNAFQYEKVYKMPLTEAWYQSQKAAMEYALLPEESEEDSILDRISKSLDRFTKRELQAAFDKFMAALTTELQKFDVHMSERLPTEYELTESEENSAGLEAESLASWEITTCVTEQAFTRAGWGD
jgi:hypothetical protein